MRLPLALLALLLGGAACTVVGAPASEDERVPKVPPSEPKGGDASADARHAGDEPKLVTVDLGLVASGQTVTLDVPSSAIGFNIVVQSGSPGTMGIERLVSPSGAVAVEGFTPAHGQTEQTRGIEGVASALVPSTDDPALQPAAGRWTITIGGEGEGARATARIQTTADGEFHGGRLPLHVYLPLGLETFDADGNGSVVSAATAADDPALSERLDVFFGALESGFDIGRGQVTFHDAPARFAAVNDDPTFWDAARLAAGDADERAAHVVFTNSLYEGAWVGFSPGVPGAAGLPGTPLSAIVQALHPENDAVFDGFTTLHELGHFAGLQHTTELEAGETDPIADTPACPIVPPPVTCVDSQNVMATLWPDGLDRVIVTPGQRKVFQGFPFYVPFATEAERPHPRAPAAPGRGLHSRALRPRYR